MGIGSNRVMQMPGDDSWLLQPEESQGPCTRPPCSCPELRQCRLKVREGSHPLPLAHPRCFQKEHEAPAERHTA